MSVRWLFAGIEPLLVNVAFGLPSGVGPFCAGIRSSAICAEGSTRLIGTTLFGNGRPPDWKSKTCMAGSRLEKSNLRDAVDGTVATQFQVLPAGSTVIRATAFPAEARIRKAEAFGQKPTRPGFGGFLAGPQALSEWPPRARERPKTVTPGKRSPRTISIPALPLSVAAFCGAKKCNPCFRKVLLGQGEWPVALQDASDRDWKE